MKVNTHTHLSRTWRFSHPYSVLLYTISLFVKPQLSVWQASRFGGKAHSRCQKGLIMQNVALLLKTAENASTTVGQRGPEVICIEQRRY